MMNWQTRLAMSAKAFAVAALLLAVPPALAQATAPAPTAAAPAVTAPVVAAPLTAQPSATPVADTPVVATEAAAPAPGDYVYVPMKPTAGKGQPVDAGLDFQDQYSPTGETGYWLSNIMLLPIMIVISVFVLGLIFWVVFRFRASVNPVPSKTTHNSLIEVLWTLIPVIILVVIAVPSIGLLAKQYEPAPKDALTIKVTGYQWYWGYTYPDNGGVEIISNMLSDKDAEARGEPAHLAADNRLVVPAGKTIRVLVTAADVIHSFAVPSLWFKMDAVPGRINEKTMFIKEPGVYYGQCSELCGARHGYMPIAIEALPPAEWDKWIVSQGGTLKGAAPAPTPAPAAVAAPVAPVAAEAAPVPAPETTPAAASAAAAAK